MHTDPCCMMDEKFYDWTKKEIWDVIRPTIPEGTGVDTTKVRDEFYKLSGKRDTAITVIIKRTYKICYFILRLATSVCSRPRTIVICMHHHQTECGMPACMSQLL